MEHAVRGRRWVSIAWLPLILAVGCSGLQRSPELPIRHAVERGQLVFYSDFHLDSNNRLLAELDGLREELSARLALPMTDESIFLYLFDGEPRYREFMRLHYPELPPRRAYFVQTETRLVVYAQWGDQAAEDLRHETTHGYLHAVSPDIPVWIDEGLAEYFEVPRNLNGFHEAHLRLLLTEWNAGRWRPDLADLEQKQTLHQMSQVDYAQSWAWTHLLLHSQNGGREVLIAYLESLRREGAVRPLSSRIAEWDPQSQERLMRHLHRLAAPRSLTPVHPPAPASAATGRFVPRPR
ncbi:MAG: basic secretory family protein [Planctomycetales bacterium]